MEAEQMASQVVAGPTVGSVSPSGGATAGGTVVTITGTGFTGASAVSFGGARARSFTVNSSTRITALSSAHAAGQSRVTVTTSGGTSAENVLFTFIARPSVTQVNPSYGPTVDGRKIVIPGTDLPPCIGPPVI
jgi:hypothetical protein